MDPARAATDNTARGTPAAGGDRRVNERPPDPRLAWSIQLADTLPMRSGRDLRLPDRTLLAAMDPSPTGLRYWISRRDGPPTSGCGPLTSAAWTFLGRPETAMVMSVDGRTRSRPQAGPADAPLAPGRPERQENEYVRTASPTSSPALDVHGAVGIFTPNSTQPNNPQILRFGGD